MNCCERSELKMTVLQNLSSLQLLAVRDTQDRELKLG